MDGTENAQDNTSEQSTETSTYTGEQVAEIRRKAESDALANAGRATAAAEKAIKIATDATAKLKKAEDRAYESARKEYQDDVPKLNSLEAERRERIAQAELDDMKQELSDEKEKRQIAEIKISESTKERNAREIATRLLVDPNLLGELSKLTDGSVEAIEAKAGMLPKVGEPQKPLFSDSGKGSGVGNLTMEQVNKFSPEEYAKNREEINKKFPLGIN